MRESIFGSEAERAVYKRLDSAWGEDVDVYPQIPVRRVVDYDTLKGLPLDEEAIEYLLKTDFDFVVCKKDSGVPVLAIEFDGMGGGFSRDGRYVSNVVRLRDPHRKRKLDVKLRACELTGVPLVVVSFPETQLLRESGEAITVLEAIIGEVRSSLGTQELVWSHTDAFTEAYNADPTGEAAGFLLDELETISEFEHNPIRRKAYEMFRKLPVSVGDYWEFLDDRDHEGYVGLRKAILGGVHIDTRKGLNRHKILLSVSIYIRDVSCLGCNALSVADCIATYSLASKALREVGTDPAVWRKLQDETPWTDG